jgi:hypothetical protein
MPFTPTLGLLFARWYARQPASRTPTIEAATFFRRCAAAILIVGGPMVAAVLGWPRFARSGSIELYAYFIVTRTIAAYLVGGLVLTLPRAFSQSRAVVSGD